MPRSTYTTTLPVAYDDALEVLAADPARILQEATDRATAATDPTTVGTGDLRYPLTCEIAGFELARDVTIEVDPVVPAELLRATVPLRWHAAQGAGWFPSVEGSLEVSPTHGDPGHTTLTLRAEHRPPFGVAGSLIHRTVARNVAATALERFLGQLADRLQELVATTELSSDIRVAPPITPPIDVVREVRFSPEAAVRTPVHLEEGHAIHLLGLEPWQGTIIDAGGATVTLVVFAGRGQLTRGRDDLPLEAGRSVTVPAGGEATLVARGQRMTVLESRVAVAPAATPAAVTSDAAEGTVTVTS